MQQIEIGSFWENQMTHIRVEVLEIHDDHVNVTRIRGKNGATKPFNVKVSALLSWWEQIKVE